MVESEKTEVGEPVVEVQVERDGQWVTVGEVPGLTLDELAEVVTESFSESTIDDWIGSRDRRQ